MDIFGIGILELAVILLVAIIFLGPARMVEMASKMGSYWRQAQRILRETADVATVNLDAPREPGKAEPEAAPDDAVAAPRPDAEGESEGRRG